MEIFPTDVWKIIMKFKVDMELYESSPHPTPNTVMGCDFHVPKIFDTDTFLLHRYTELLFGDCDDTTLTEYIRDYVNLPLVMLTEYIQALKIYRERLSVWGIPEEGRVPEHWTDTTASVVQDYCDTRDRDMYTQRLVQLLRNNKTRRLFL